MANSLNQSSNQEVIISVYSALKRKWEGRVVWEGNTREGGEREEDKEMQKERRETKLDTER